jgi:anti-sigma B factor antagonist
MFEINHVETHLISLSGRLDASQAEKASTVLNDMQETVTLDFKDLEYISSAGLSIILVTQKRLKDNDQEVIIKNMNRHIREIFRYAGFDQIIRIDD